MDNIIFEQDINNVELKIGEENLEINLEGGVQGKQGIQGVQGIPGDPGPSNTLSIGTVTSGAEAEASISGTSPNQILNLVLPKGDKGDPGTTNYPDLTNLPTINNVTLSGNKTSTDLGLQPAGDYVIEDELQRITDTEIDNFF